MFQAWAWQPGPNLEPSECSFRDVLSDIDMRVLGVLSLASLTRQVVLP